MALLDFAKDVISRAKESSKKMKLKIKKPEMGNFTNAVKSRVAPIAAIIGPGAKLIKNEIEENMKMMVHNNKGFTKDAIDIATEGFRKKEDKEENKYKGGEIE